MRQPSASIPPASPTEPHASGRSVPRTEQIGGTRVDGDAPARVIEPGTILSKRYLIERAIGSGGMSTVFSALDRHRMHGPAADAKVAVKVLNGAHPDDSGRVQRLIREFRYMQRLTHRGIVRVFDVDCDEGTWFITMELLQGEPLTEYLQRHEPAGLPTEEALRLLTECTDALVCAHDHGVIHGDLKPGNIFIDTRGAARLIDFGSVPEAGESLENDTRFLTPAYASPQMLEEQPADLRDDLFSLGCIAYELFGGEHPFGMKSSLEAQRDDLRLTWLRSIPARHFGMIARMLSWEREARPTDGREFLESLTAAQVRAKHAYSRDARPAASHSTPSQPERPAARDTTAHGAREAAPATGSRGHSRPAQSSDETREQLARRFAQFAGVVPDDWVGHVEPASPPASRSTQSQPAQTATTEPNETARSRWSKAIPPDLVEPRSRSQDTIPAARTKVKEAPAPAKEEEAAATVDEPLAEEAPVETPTRASSWFGSLKWNDAKVLRRVARREPVKEPEPAVDVPPPPTSTAHVLLRATTPVNWTALVSRLRTLRVRPASHIAPALNATPGTPPSPSAAVQAATDWTPQLRWQDQRSIRWNDLQVPPAPTVTPQIQLGTLQQPMEPQVPPAAAATVPRPIITREQINAQLSRVSAYTRKSLSAVGVAGRNGWRHASSYVTHWQRLRLSIGSLVTATETRDPSWLSQRVPRWREAVPAMAIAGLALVTWGLLQLSDASRSSATASAEQRRESEQRLQAMADAPIDITYPVIVSPPLPSVQQAAAVVLPPASGVISFQSALVRVSAGQRMAVVNLRRNQSTNGSAPFSWRIAPGTARPGVDYEPLKAQVARFNDGQDVRTLFIPLKPSDNTRPERRFKIVLTKTPGAPAFGDITETEVVIAGSG